MAYSPRRFRQRQPRPHRSEADPPTRPRRLAQRLPMSPGSTPAASASMRPTVAPTAQSTGPEIDTHPGPALPRLRPMPALRRRPATSPAQQRQRP